MHGLAGCWQVSRVFPATLKPKEVIFCRLPHLLCQLPLSSLVQRSDEAAAGHCITLHALCHHMVEHINSQAPLAPLRQGTDQGRVGDGVPLHAKVRHGPVRTFEFKTGHRAGATRASRGSSGNSKRGARAEKQPHSSNNSFQQWPAQHRRQQQQAHSVMCLPDALCQQRTCGEPLPLRLVPNFLRG